MEAKVNNPHDPNTTVVMPKGRFEAIINACLGIAKRRHRNGEKTLSPCWCETQDINCIGQPQCIACTEALKEI